MVKYSSVAVCGATIPVLFVIFVLYPNTGRPQLHRYPQFRDVSFNKSVPTGLRSLLQKVSCSKVSGSEEEEVRDYLSEIAIISRTKNCSDYFTRHFPLRPTSSLDYPLAFTHLVHKEVGIFEAFMALTYDPADSHCVFVDGKSSVEVRKAVDGIVRCYNSLPDPTGLGGRVFVFEKSEDVYWAHFSILSSELKCLKALLERAPRWNFVLTSAGTELPLLSLDELKRLSSHLKGSITGGSLMPDDQKWRYIHSWTVQALSEHESKIVMTSEHKPPAPFNLTVLKSAKGSLLTRDFVHFILNHPVSKAYLNWISDMAIPDESFYNTLAKISEISANGSRVKQDLSKDTSFGYRVQSIIWQGNNNQCTGAFIRNVCNLGLQDLHAIRRPKHLIANKFNLQISSSAVICQVANVLAREQQAAGSALEQSSLKHEKATTAYS